MEINNLEIEVSRLANPNFPELMEIWNALRGVRFAPAWHDVNLSTFPGTIIPFITVVDVTEEPVSFIYRFWGTGHTRVKGTDLTGKSPLSTTPREVAEFIHYEFTRVRDKATPMAFLHDIRPQPDEPSRFQETLRLPLSSDGETVTNILSLADWQTDQIYWSEMYNRLRSRAPEPPF